MTQSSRSELTRQIIYQKAKEGLEAYQKAGHITYKNTISLKLTIKTMMNNMPDTFFEKGNARSHAAFWIYAALHKLKLHYNLEEICKAVHTGENPVRNIRRRYNELV